MSHDHSQNHYGPNASFDGHDSDLASAGILIESLRQQLAAAYEAGKRDAIPEWQPMETAPKNGTAFRAYADELIDLDFNPWGSVEAAWNGEEFIGCVWNGQQDSWYGKAITPSHWIPLPAAPKGLK